jgi:hypothetical protein
MTDEERGIVGPVDLDALANHVIRLSGELERAWSAALDAGVLPRVAEELDGDIGALATGFIGAVQLADEKLVAAGIDPTIKRWPYDPDLFKSLNPDASAEEQREQLVTAQMIVLQNVLQAFKALGEPSGEEVDLGTQSRTEWFEAGAFLLLKRRALLLLRITREIERVGEALVGEPEVPKLDLSIQTAIESLGAAGGAYAIGEIEAGILHCRRALQAVLESMPFIGIGDERLERPGALLAQVPSLEEWAPALELLDREAEALLQRGVDLGIAVPLLGGLMPVLSDIVHEPPLEELHALLGSGEAEA